MMKKIVHVLFFSILLQPIIHGQQAPADLILVNGKVFTSEAVKPAAEAIAIRGERILAVGTSAEIEKLKGKTTRRIDLQGRLVTPGFNAPTLPQTTSVLTIVGGKIVYNSNALE